MNRLNTRIESLIYALAKQVTKGWRGVLYAIIAALIWAIGAAPLFTLALTMLALPYLTAENVKTFALCIGFFLEAVGLCMIFLAVKLAWSPEFEKLAEIRQRWIDSERASRKLP